MAGDWIKVEHVTPDKPEVFEIGEHAGLKPDEAFGKLMRFWIWADQQFETGQIEMLSDSKIDFIVRQKGFAKAMRAVGWLADVDGKTIIPNFERHNGTTAKERADSNRRMAKSRAIRNIGDDSVAGIPQQSDITVAEKAQQKPQPEKRREEKNKKQIQTRAAKTPLPPNFSISDSVRNWAREKGHDRLEQRLDDFIGKAKAKGYEYADWDQAFMNAVRGNWAGLPEPATNQFAGAK